MKCKFSARYRNGFREGFANPNRNKETINSFLTQGKEFSNDKSKEYFDGLVEGVAKREQLRRKGEDKGFYYAEEIDKILNNKIC